MEPKTPAAAPREHSKHWKFACRTSSPLEEGLEDLWKEGVENLVESLDWTCASYAFALHTHHIEGITFYALRGYLTKAHPCGVEKIHSIVKDNELVFDHLEMANPEAEKEERQLCLKRAHPLGRGPWVATKEEMIERKQLVKRDDSILTFLDDVITMPAHKVEKKYPKIAKKQKACIMALSNVIEINTDDDSSEWKTTHSDSEEEEAVAKQKTKGLKRKTPPTPTPPKEEGSKKHKGESPPQAPPEGKGGLQAPTGPPQKVSFGPVKPPLAVHVATIQKETPTAGNTPVLYRRMVMTPTNPLFPPRSEAAPTKVPQAPRSAPPGFPGTPTTAQ